MLLLHQVWIFVCSLLIGSFQWAGFYLFHEKSRTLSQRFKKYLRYIHPNCPIFKLRTYLQAIVEYGNYKHSPHERLIGRIFYSRYILSPARHKLWNSMLHTTIHLSRIIYSSLWIDYRCDKFYGVNDMDVDNHLHRRKTFTLIRSTNSAGFHFCTLACFILYTLV